MDGRILENVVPALDEGIRLLETEQVQYNGKGADKGVVVGGDADVGFREDVVACLTRELLEQQQAVERLREELKARHISAAAPVSTLQGINRVTDSDVEIDHMLDSIDRSLSTQETYNQQALSRFNPTQFMETLLESSGTGEYCRIRKDELDLLISTYKQSKEDLTNSHILISSLKDKEHKLSTIIDQERNHNTRLSPLASPHLRLSEPELRRPENGYGSSQDLVGKLEKSVAEERAKISQLLDTQRQYENEIIRLEDEVQKQQEHAEGLERNYQLKMTALEGEVEQTKMENNNLKEQYKKLYAYVNQPT